MTEQKNVYVVLGMARSGTSAITRGLQALGVDLGNHLIPANDKWNAKGFFEDNDIVYKINRRVLTATDRNGMFVNLTTEMCESNEVLRNLKNAAVHLVKERLAATRHWGFKDPRTAKVLPFWESVFNTLRVHDHYIFTVRNPLASAHSYMQLSGCDLEEALLLWLAHLLPAVDATHEKNRIVVSYELMLQDPHPQLARIKEGLNIKTPVNQADIDMYANEFLDKKMHHYAYSDTDLRLHPAMAVTPLCLQVYELFMQLARDEMRFNGDAFLSAWQEIKNEFAKVYPIYCYLHGLTKRTKQLERDLRTIHRSIPWKLIYPLRIIDDALRGRRRKSREKNRLVKIYE